MNRLQIMMLSALCLCSIPRGAHAEGNCPPGFYPVCGQGVQGCAPIPGSQANTPTGVARPQGRWIDGWGAVASSASTHDTGFSSGIRSRSGAEKMAIQRCSEDCARDCRIIQAIQESMFAWAVPVTDGPGTAAGLARAPGLKNAESMAPSECVDPEGRTCDIFY